MNQDAILKIISVPYCNILKNQGRNQGGGAKAPLSQVNVKFYTQFCACNPIKMLLQHYRTLPVI